MVTGAIKQLKTINKQKKEKYILIFFNTLEA